MISASLPAVFLGYQVAYSEVIEALAMTYWSSYNDQAVQPRVLTSMQRSWQVLDVTAFPAPGDGSPGFIVVRIGTIDNYRVIIAIEGIRTIASVITANPPIMPKKVFSTAGCVFSLAYNDYVLLAARLAANALVSSWISNPRRIVTFAGFSLGAAVAEVWANKFIADSPARDVRLIKFGAPRVGDSDWYNARRPRPKKVNFYSYDDPMNSVPTISAPRPFTVPGITSPGMTWYMQDTVQYAVNHRGNRFNSKRDWFNYRQPALLYWLTQAYTEANPFYYHQLDYYRLVACSLLGVTDQDLYYRFKNMEFNDENSWAGVYTQGQVLTPGLKVLLSPEPDPVAPPTPAIAAQDGVIEGGGGQDFDGVVAEQGGIAGGFDADWNVAPVVQTQLRPQRRLRLTR